MGCATQYVLFPPDWLRFCKSKAASGALGQDQSKAHGKPKVAYGVIIVPSANAQTRWFIERDLTYVKVVADSVLASLLLLTLVLGALIDDLRILATYP